MNSLLGICIPTYKRPDQLTACVRSILLAASHHEVPVYIADDSTDETNEQAIKQLQREYPFIFTSKNKANLGIDKNILNAVDLCPCKYAWMMGEDDRLTPDAVDQILGLLSSLDSEQWPFIFVNYASVDADIHYYLNRQVLPLEEDLIESAEQFLVSHAWAAGFIGGCIVNTTAWEKIEREHYIGTYFAHIGIIMEMIQGRQVHLVARPLVLNRCGEPRLFTWSDATFTVAGGWGQLMQRLVPIYGRELCQRATMAFEAAHGLYSLRFLCYTRADYAYRTKHYREFIQPLTRSRGYQLLARIIAYTPPALFYSLRFVISRYRRMVNPKVATDKYLNQ
ncbi:glycosyltransferase family 2 protein [Desulfobulbus alkaliphilus]|uniref:glycosyltransferase family 2 protein n=1 Tax=Desulfobulbus alkaliphilus TaxID=869814 RepID=UPI0019632C67|nr:glycosyltransferase [Desulfobulbus alkaliphilus]MBM9538193.1 glycosyltransferase [Desulfobulbus alkaliphilus]